MKARSDGQAGLTGAWTGVLAPGRDIGVAVRAGPLVLGHRHHSHAVLVSTMRDDVHRGAAVAPRPRPRASDGGSHRRLARLEAARGLIAGPPLDRRAE